MPAEGAQFVKHKPAKNSQARRDLSARIFAPVALVASLLVALQVLSNQGIIQHFVLPPPTAVLQAFVNDLPVMGQHIWTTLRIAALGFVMSTAVGALFAVLMDRVRLVYLAFYPLVVASQTIPIMVITPVIVLIFGYSDLPRLAVVILTCFFPVTISLFQGLRAVDQDRIRLMQTMGASAWDTVRHVRWPSALPHFFAGLRIAATYCVMAAVLAEWSGGGEGLGIFMLRTKRSFRFDRMFACVLWIIVLSLLFYGLAALLERLAMPWRQAAKRAGQSQRELAL